MQPNISSSTFSGATLARLRASPDNDGAQLGGGGILQGTAKGADRGTAAIHDIEFFHGISPFFIKILVFRRGNHFRLDYTTGVYEKSTAKFHFLAQKLTLFLHFVKLLTVLQHFLRLSQLSAVSCPFSVAVSSAVSPSASVSISSEKAS